MRPKPEFEPRDYLMDSINKELHEKDVRIWELENELEAAKATANIHREVNQQLKLEIEALRNPLK